MRKFKFTHHNGVTSEAIARDLLDAVFSFRGNYHNLIKVEEVPVDVFLSQEKNMSNEEFEAHLATIQSKHEEIPTYLKGPSFRDLNGLGDNDEPHDYDFEFNKD